MPDPPRKPESSRAFETHADDAKPTGIRRYINILAIVVPILIALVLVLIIVHSLNEPASNPSPTASTEPSPTPSTPSPTPTADQRHPPPHQPQLRRPSPPGRRLHPPKPKTGHQNRSRPQRPLPPTRSSPSPWKRPRAMRISGDKRPFPRQSPTPPRSTELSSSTPSISKTGTVAGGQNRQRPTLAPGRRPRRRQNVSLSALPDQRKASPRPHPGGCDFHAPLQRQQLYCPLSVEWIKASTSA